MTKPKIKKVTKYKVIFRCRAMQFQCPELSKVFPYVVLKKVFLLFSAKVLTYLSVLI